MKIPIPNCYALTKEGECKHCESFFYLSNQECIPCAKKIENCYYCRGKEDDAKCIQCQPGFQLNENTCTKCPENCNSCSEEGCQMCMEGYYLDEEKKECVKCEIEKCENCNTKDIC